MIDYSFLIAPNRHRDKDSTDEDGFGKEISTLQKIAENDELKHLVSHPVLSSFLFLKWSRLSSLFYLNLVLCSMFMLALVSFIVVKEVVGFKAEYPVIFWTLKLISIVSIALLMARELFQFVLNYTQYFKSFMNWFEIILIVIACAAFTMDSKSRKNMEKKLENGEDNNEADFVRVIKAFLILGASFEFLQIVGTLPFLSVSTHMVILKRVSVTFLKSIFLYSILIFAFGLSFFVVLHLEIHKPRTKP